MTVGGGRLGARGRRINEQQMWALTAWVLLAVVSVGPAVVTPAKFDYDSFSYFSPPTLSSGRLPLVPLVYLVLGRNVDAVSVTQAVLGGICWAALLWEMSYVRPRILRLAVMGPALWLACSTYVAGWYAAILSESLSISLLALLVALLARWQRTGSGLWPVAVVICLSAWTRATSAYVVLAVGVAFTVYSAARNRSLLAKSVLVTAMGLAASLVSGEGTLWQEPFLHSMTERILTSPGLTAWFRHHGMPLSDGLERLAGPFSGHTEAAYQHDPALASFRDWMNHSGKLDYAWFLTSHPWWVVKGAFGHHEELGGALMAYYAHVPRRPWLPSGVRDLFLDRRQDCLVLLGLADAGALIHSGHRRSLGRSIWVWVALIAVGTVTLALDWAGDSWEVGRHSVEGTILVALAGLMLLGHGHVEAASGSSPVALDAELPI